MYLITFTNERLLEKFNIFGCQRKGWLPPTYGKKRRENMTADEKTVVDSFHDHDGKTLYHAYDDIVRDSKYYIVESGQLLLGGA